MIFKRIKNLWDLGRYKPKDKRTFDLGSYNDVIVNNGPIVDVVLEEDIPLGNGKAEFLGEGTEEEFKEMERDDKGLKGIFGL